MTPSLKKIIRNLLCHGAIVGMASLCASFIYNHYDVIIEQAKFAQPNYFEHHEFIEDLHATTYLLRDSMDTLVHTLRETQEVSSEGLQVELGADESDKNLTDGRNDDSTLSLDSYFSNSYYLEQLQSRQQELEHYPGDWDYYYQSASGEVKSSAKGDLLSTLLSNAVSEAGLTKLTKQFQFWAQLTFDETGKLRIERIYGASADEVLSQLKNEISYLQESTLLPPIQSTTIVYGIPTQLNDINSTLYRNLNYIDELPLILAVVPYLIGLLGVMYVTVLCLPYDWLMNSTSISTVSRTPLEIRALFAAATCFLVMFSPLLILLTQEGILVEQIERYFSMTQAPLYVDVLNLSCWFGLALVVAIHTLFVKDFFVLGFKRSIKKRTVFGWGYTWFKRKIKWILYDDFSILLPKNINTSIAETEISLKASDLVSKSIENASHLFLPTTLRVRYRDEKACQIEDAEKVEDFVGCLLEHFTESIEAENRIYLETLDDNGETLFVLRGTLKKNETLSDLSESFVLATELGLTLTSDLDGDLVKWILCFPHIL